MDATTAFTIACSLIATLFGILSVLIGWVGSRVVTKQDEIMDKLEDIKDDMNSKLNRLDLRLVRVETRVGISK